LSGHLGRHELLTLLTDRPSAQEGVLELRLQVAPEAASRARVSTRHASRSHAALAAVPVGDLAEELLVPAERPKSVRVSL
jgi:hypothetical protein